MLLSPTETIFGIHERVPRAVATACLGRLDSEHPRRPLSEFRRRCDTYELRLQPMPIYHDHPASSGNGPQIARPTPARPPASGPVLASRRALASPPGLASHRA